LTFLLIKVIVRTYSYTGALMTKLEKILIEKGIKKVWIAKKLNKRSYEVSNWLKGKRIPPYEVMVKLSKALNIPVDEIFSDEVLESAIFKRITSKTNINNNHSEENK
jgi:transcriptional regulator with XRE-family HTH domain